MSEFTKEDALRFVLLCGTLDSLGYRRITLPTDDYDKFEKFVDEFFPDNDEVLKTIEPEFIALREKLFRAIGIEVPADET